MNIKSEKGFTVMDISIAVAVLFIFVSLIAALAYNFNSTSKEMELKSKAVEIAVNEIEKIKDQTIDELKDGEKKFDTTEGFEGKITVEDGATMNTGNPGGISSIKSGYVKKVTVKVQYKFKKEIKSIELSTIISKEN